MKTRKEQEEEKQAELEKVQTLTNSYLMVDNDKINGVIERYYNWTDYNKFSRPTEDQDVGSGMIMSAGSGSSALPNPISGIRIMLPDGNSTTTALGWAATGEQNSGWVRNGADDYSYLVNGTSVTEWLASEFRVNYLTAGSVLFAGTSGKVNQDNSNFFWDDSNNRLGIGCTDPFRSLEIRHASLPQLVLASDADNAVIFQGSGTGLVVNGYSTQAHGEIDFYNFRGAATADIVELSVYNTATSGASSAKLMVQVDSSSTGDPYFQAYNGTTYWTHGLDNSDSDAYVWSQNAALGTTNRMRLDTSGNLFLPIYTAGSVLYVGSSGQVSQNNAAFFWDNALVNLNLTRSTTTTTPTLELFQSSTGDSALRYTLSGANSFITGIDNSDSDAWKLSYGSTGNAALGTNDYLTFETNGDMTIGGATRFMFWDESEGRLDVQAGTATGNNFVNWTVLATSGANRFQLLGTANGTGETAYVVKNDVNVQLGMAVTASGGSPANTISIDGTDMAEFKFHNITSAAFGFYVQNTLRWNIATGGLLAGYIGNALTTPHLDLTQTSTGDSAIRWTLSGGNSFIAGIDNSASDQWSLSYGSAGNAVLGTNDYLTITTAGAFTLNGATTINGLTTIGGSNNLLVGGIITVGSTYATTGDIRLAYGGSIWGRNSADSGNNSLMDSATVGGNTNIVRIGAVSGGVQVGASSGLLGFLGSTPVAQPTYTISNVTTDRSYDADSTTLAEVADALGTLIADLRAYGLVL